MRNTPLRSEKNNKDKQKIAEDAQMAGWVERLYPIEERFITKCREAKIKWSFDVTAREHFYFDTLNYTTFGKGIIMHPLQPELAMKQTCDALADLCEFRPFADTFEQRVKSEIEIKWGIADKTADLPSEEFSAVILPGENKLKEKVCIDKIKHIEQGNELVVYKPHPFTNDETLKELCGIAGIADERMLSPRANMHSVLVAASKVYTTHLSESCAYAVALNKPVEPIDAIGNRDLSSFVHINYHLFLSANPRQELDQMFSSPKSGLIDPEIDTDWEQKMDEYFDYVLSMRDRVKGFYIQ